MNYLGVVETKTAQTVDNKINSNDNIILKR